MTGFNGQCEVYLERFQDPTKSDAMSRLQTDLDDTKIILVSCPSVFRLIIKLLVSGHWSGSSSILYVLDILLLNYPTFILIVYFYL